MLAIIILYEMINTLRPRQNGRHSAHDIFKCIILNENVWIPIKISLKFVPKSPINNISALVQIMAWRRPGDKPLSEPMMVSLPTHICVARPHWVNVWDTVSAWNDPHLWPPMYFWANYCWSLKTIVLPHWSCTRLTKICFFPLLAILFSNFKWEHSYF